VTKATALKPTNPAYYASIFERGIDPGESSFREPAHPLLIPALDVDNPEICHEHSEIPDSWPPMDEINQYQFDVRDRILSLIHSGTARRNRRLGRGLWLAFEHEAMHLETFLYMLLQSERVLPPPGVNEPDFRGLALEAKHRRVPNRWHQVPDSKVVVGIDDPENDLGPDRFFGWDNERPSRYITVGAFEAQSRPISNGEYARFLEMTGRKALPVSWTTKAPEGAYTNGVNGIKINGEINGIVNGDSRNIASKTFTKGISIRTVFGLVPLEYALDWPVMASYDELAAFAKWSHARIPTLEEVRSIYNYVKAEKEMAQNYPSKLISAVNG
jgi:L-histidine Nalpha-methyltransferase / hercynylcysteine S-oxide synthase